MVLQEIDISGHYLLKLGCLIAKCKYTPISLKSGSQLPKRVILFTSMESPLKMMKNAFHFILKVLFVLEILKFLSLLFGHVGKTAWLGR